MKFYRFSPKPDRTFNVLKINLKMFHIGPKKICSDFGWGGAFGERPFLDETRMILKNILTLGGRPRDEGGLLQSKYAL